MPSSSPEHRSTSSSIPEERNRQLLDMNRSEKSPADNAEVRAYADMKAARYNHMLSEVYRELDLTDETREEAEAMADALMLGENLGILGATAHDVIRHVHRNLRAMDVDLRLQPGPEANLDLISLAVDEELARETRQLQGFFNDLKSGARGKYSPHSH